MREYKEIIISVPKDMKFLSVDSSGARYLSQQEPIYDRRFQQWGKAYFLYIGDGPIPEDASKELYRI